MAMTRLAKRYVGNVAESDSRGGARSDQDGYARPESGRHQDGGHHLWWARLASAQKRRAADRRRGCPDQVKDNIKYLVLDRKWDDGRLFSRLAPKLVGTASAVGRLVPNGGGPKGACRSIYAGMARSMELYGSPIWANRLSEQNKALI